MKEQTRHRLAFDLYVRLGARRSLEALGRALGDDPSLIALRRAPGASTIERWSSAFHWMDRLADLERKARVRDEESQLKELREMNERHRKEALALQQKSLARIAGLGADDMNAADAIRGLIEGVRLERLATGAPTEHVRKETELHGHLDLRGFSVEELRRLAELAECRTTGAGEAEPEQPA